MTREELEHLIRAAGEIADDDLVVIGSQAILATHPNAPRPMLLSMEADLYPRSDPGEARVIDSTIGDGSSFHATHGIYAHGVGPETAKAPAGWEDRLVLLTAKALLASQSARRGWCLEPHDLVLAKLARGEQRDWDFADLALRHGLVDAAILRERAGLMPDSHRDHARRSLEGVIARAGSPG